MRPALIALLAATVAGCGGEEPAVGLGEVQAALGAVTGERCGQIGVFERDTYQTPHVSRSASLTCGRPRQPRGGAEPLNALLTYFVLRSPEPTREGGAPALGQLYWHGNVTIYGRLRAREWAALVRRLPRNEAG